MMPLKDDLMLIEHLDKFHTESKKLLETMQVDYNDHRIIPFVSQNDLLDYMLENSIELEYIYEFIGFGYKTICFVSKSEILHINPEPMTTNEMLYLYKCKLEDDYFKFQMTLMEETGELK